MSLRLPLVLSERDLPLPELLAAGLDGEVFRVGGAFAPVDEIVNPAHRAHAILDLAPARYIAEQHSAAWVWGALGMPPLTHEFCVNIGARVTGSPARRHRVREVVIERREITVFGDVSVTTPLRTALDLARFSDRFGADEARATLELMRLADFSVDDCLAELNGRRNLPNKRQAIQRLTQLTSENNGNRPRAQRLF
jgi:hypothetical protein